MSTTSDGRAALPCSTVVSSPCCTRDHYSHNPAMEPFMRGVTLYLSGRQAGTSSGGWQSRPPRRLMKPAVSGHPGPSSGARSLKADFLAPSGPWLGGKLKLIPASLSQDKTGTSRVRLLALRGRHAKGRQGSFGGIASLVSNSINAR
jgi:hypothetical protein